MKDLGTPYRLEMRADSLPSNEEVSIFEMKWRPRAFSRVSTGDSDILSSCDMNDEHA